MDNLEYDWLMMMPFGAYCQLLARDCEAQYESVRSG